MKRLILTTMYAMALLLTNSCQDNVALAQKSFGIQAKAGSVSVISMGRDDDDGKAKKWHIGGGTN